MSEESNYALTTNLHLAPLRSIDEFILDQARFQLPAVNDLKKWNNRIVTNLLYYQSNYFIMLAIMALIGGFANLQDVSVGLSALVILGVALLAGTTTHGQIVLFRREHPYVTLASIVAASCYTVYVLPAVIVLLFVILIPVLLVFIHASIRLRNFGAKWNYAAEKLHLRQTPMSKILDVLDVDVKGV